MCCRALQCVAACCSTPGTNLNLIIRASWIKSRLRLALFLEWLSVKIQLSSPSELFQAPGAWSASRDSGHLVRDWETWGCQCSVQMMKVETYNKRSCRSNSRLFVIEAPLYTLQHAGNGNTATQHSGFAFVTVTRCNTLQHHTLTERLIRMISTATRCNTLQHTTQDSLATWHAKLLQPYEKLVDNFSPESDVTSLQDPFTSRPYKTPF